MTDDFVIQVIAKRMSEECGWDQASKALNHGSWVDVVTHLMTEKGLRGPLMEAYKTEIVNARAQQLLDSESDSLPM